MLFECFSSGFESNCFVVWGERAAVIDAGLPYEVISKIRGLNISTDCLLITHSHFDHVVGLPVLVKEVGGRVAVHGLDATALECCDDRRVLGYLFGERSPKIKVDVLLEDGDVIDLGGGVRLEVIHTPGHTPGGVCFYEPREKILFSGDTVFADGVGRTDFCGGDLNVLKKSVEKLLRLHKSRGINVFYPGHGPKAEGDLICDIYEEYFS